MILVVRERIVLFIQDTFRVVVLRDHVVHSVLILGQILFVQGLFKFFHFKRVNPVLKLLYFCLHFLNFKVSNAFLIGEKLH